MPPSALASFAFATAVLVASAGCARTPVEYETTVQANRTETDGKTLVIALAKNTAAPADAPDVASATILLADGESKTAVFRNKYYPGREYAFTASLSRPMVTVVVEVRDGASVRWTSTQKFTSWRGL